MKQPRPLVRVLLLGASLWSLGIVAPGCEVLPDGRRETGAEKASDVLRVGVQTWDLPSVDEAFSCIEQAFKGALVLHGHERVVEIEPFAVYKELLAALAENRVDVARLEAGSYVTARQGQPGITMLAAERPSRGGPRQGMIVTAAGATIDKLAALRGKSFAFGDEHASLGRHLPQAALLAAGLRAADLRHTAYLRGSDKVAAAVRLGEFDAGVLEAGAFRRLNTDSGLRVLAPLIDAPRPWVARAGLERGVVTALADALLGLEDVRCLRVLDASGLGRPDENAYEHVRAAMATTPLFGTGARAHGASSPALPRR